MDVGMISSAVMQALTQFIPFAGGTLGTAVVTSIGNDLYDKGKEQARRLFDAVRHRFSQEPDGGSAARALQTYIDGDRDFAPVIQTKLERILDDDPAFAAQLLAIMRSGPLQSLIMDEEGTARRIEMSNSAGEGTQNIQGGKRSVVEDVKMNISNPD